MMPFTIGHYDGRICVDASWTGQLEIDDMPTHRDIWAYSHQIQSLAGPAGSSRRRSIL